MPTIVPIALTLLSGGFNLQTILIVLLVMSISLSFHEYMHGYVAYRLGDDTASLAGRLTMNPLAHLDPSGTLMFFLLGIGYAKPVPINPARFTRGKSMKFGIMLTSLAGPAANLLLAIVAVFLFYGTVTVAEAAALQVDNPVLRIFLNLFEFLYQSNIVLMVFNLLPIPPLDGSKVFSYLLPNELYYKFLSLQRYSGIILMLVFIFGRNIISTVLTYIRIPFDYIIMTPIAALFQALWRLLGFV